MQTVSSYGVELRKQNIPVRQTLETWVTKSIKEGKISVEEGKEFLSNYRSGLYGYTYLE